MRTDELRDWHARHDGWVKLPKRRKCADGRILDDWRGPNGSMVLGHPYPPTRDGAASAMPDGHTFIKVCRPGGAYEWAVQRYHGINSCWVPDTGDEIHDRYLLAKLAKEEMSQGRTKEKA